MIIPDSLYSIGENDVVYRCIGDDFSNGILSCGYMLKKDVSKSQYNFVINYYSCFVLLRGKGFYIGCDGSRTPITPGCLVQRIPKVMHSTEIVPDGEWLEFYISFGFETYQNLLNLGVIHSEPPVLNINLTQNLLECFSRLLREMKAAPDAELPPLLFRAQQILFDLQKNHETILPDNRAMIAKALDILGQNLDSRISAEDAAHQLGIGYETFRKVFKAETGFSPAAYRISRRISHAKMLLQTELSISEIAALTGYGDCYVFSKEFKKSVGLSPRKYRKLQLVSA